jgi:hypothetical protein
MTSPIGDRWRRVLSRDQAEADGSAGTDGSADEAWAGDAPPAVGDLPRRVEVLARLERRSFRAGGLVGRARAVLSDVYHTVRNSMRTFGEGYHQAYRDFRRIRPRP